MRGTVQGVGFRPYIHRIATLPQDSSAGRLFDAAAAMLGICDDAGYEGEAADRHRGGRGAGERTVSRSRRVLDMLLGEQLPRIC